jgi:hypothetical protein
MYDIVFLITHNDLVKDWGDNVLTVVKEGHISKVTVKKKYMRFRKYCVIILKTRRKQLRN